MLGLPFGTGILVEDIADFLRPAHCGAPAGPGSTWPFGVTSLLRNEKAALRRLDASARERFLRGCSFDQREAPLQIRAMLLDRFLGRRRRASVSSFGVACMPRGSTYSRMASSSRRDVVHEDRRRPSTASSAVNHVSSLPSLLADPRRACPSSRVVVRDVLRRSVEQRAVWARKSRLSPMAIVHALWIIMRSTARPSRFRRRASRGRIAADAACRRRARSLVAGWPRRAVTIARAFEHVAAWRVDAQVDASSP
jgi:hypothetical protein